MYLQIFHIVTLYLRYYCENTRGSLTLEWKKIICKIYSVGIKIFFKTVPTNCANFFKDTLSFSFFFGNTMSPCYQGMPISRKLMLSFVH